jgi:rfaE bifunctional protein nucleotidyltransferase chain/domain
MKRNIWSLTDINELKNSLNGKKIVLAGGCFDLLHYGHFTFLQNAKQEGDVLVVALESDEFIQKQKNRKPVHNQKQRAEILAALEQVDYVLLLPLFESHDEYRKLVTDIKPSVIALTEGDKHQDRKQKHAESVGATIKVVSSLLPEFSTTRILNI